MFQIIFISNITLFLFVSLPYPVFYISISHIPYLCFSASFSLHLSHALSICLSDSLFSRRPLLCPLRPSTHTHTSPLSLFLSLFVVSLTVSLFRCLFLCLSLSPFLLFSLSLCFPIFLVMYLFQFVCLSLSRQLSAPQPIASSLSLFLPVCLSPCHCLALSLSRTLYLSICLSHILSVFL